MSAKVTVKLKERNRSAVESTIIHRVFKCTLDDPEIEKCVDTALSKFKGDPIETKIRVSIELIED